MKIVIGALLLCLGTTSFAHNIYLQIPGIPGDSVTKGLENTIQIQSLSWAIQSFNSCATIDVAKVADTATGGLIMAATKGGFIEDAKLTITAPEYAKGSGEAAVFELNLTGPVIRAINIHTESGAMPMEHISITFDTVTGRSRGISGGKLLPWTEFKPTCL